MKTKMNASEVIERSRSLFGKHGFKKVSMTDIASAAQISRPTLYSLYPDKESVFAACILSHVREFKVEALAGIQKEKKTERKLRVLFEIYIMRPFTWYFESEAYEMMVNASAYAPEEMAIFWKDFEDGIRRVLARSPSADDVAKVLVCFARDARSNAKNSKELSRLVDSAIGLALR